MQYLSHLIKRQILFIFIFSFGVGFEHIWIRTRTALLQPRINVYQIWDESDVENIGDEYFFRYWVKSTSIHITPIIIIKHYGSTKPFFSAKHNTEALGINLENALELSRGLELWWAGSKKKLSSWVWVRGWPFFFWTQGWRFIHARA